MTNAECASTGERRTRFAVAVLAASVPFSLAGFGILELPIRWGERSPFLSGMTGLILATFSVGYGAAQIPGGILTVRRGGERVLRSAVLICLVSWPCVLAPQWVVIGFGRLIFGFGAGLTYSSGLMLMRERVDEKDRTTAVAIFGSAWAVGNGLAALVGYSEVTSGILIFIGGGVALLLLRSDGAKSVPARSRILPRSREEASDLLTTGVKVMLFVTPAGLLANVTLGAWGPSTARGEAETSIVAVGLLVAGGILVGNWVGNLADRLKNVNAIVAGSPLIAGLFVVLFATAGDSKTFRLSAVFLTVTVSLVHFPPGMARVFRELPANSQPFTTAVINQSGWLASALGPATLGLAATGNNPPPMAAWLGVASAVAVAGGLASIINHKAEARK